MELANIRLAKEKSSFLKELFCSPGTPENPTST
jgi:hypothetical protein